MALVAFAAPANAAELRKAPAPSTVGIGTSQSANGAWGFLLPSPEPPPNPGGLYFGLVFELAGAKIRAFPADEAPASLGSHWVNGAN